MSGPKLFYHCYDHQRPTGGQKRCYRHVDILRNSGYEAYAFHAAPGYRLEWFANSTAVIDAGVLSSLYDPERDYVVLPEDLPFCRYGNRWPGRKVIFNKNLYLGFAHADSASASPYTDPTVSAALTVSEHNRRHLQFAFPRLPVIKVGTSVDTNVFRFLSLPEKRRQIVCSAKTHCEIMTVCRMFQARARAGLNRGLDYEWIFIDGFTEEAVARLFHESPVLIFLSMEEGIPRMPLEAMRSGCLVAGRQAGPLKELPQFAFHCEPGESIPVVEFLERLVAAGPADLAHWTAVAQDTFEQSLHFTAAGEEASVAAAWSRILEFDRCSNKQMARFA
jgi:hypothetical protein